MLVGNTFLVEARTFVILLIKCEWLSNSSCRKPLYRLQIKILLGSASIATGFRIYANFPFQASDFLTASIHSHMQLHLYSYNNNYGCLFPLHLPLMEQIFLDTVSLPRFLVPWITGGKVTGQICLYLFIYLFFLLLPFLNTTSFIKLIISRDRFFSSRG